MLKSLNLFIQLLQDLWFCKYNKSGLIDLILLIQYKNMVDNLGLLTLVTRINLEF